MPNYELMLVLQPELEDDGVESTVKLVTDVVDQTGGSLHFAGQLIDKKGNVARPRDGWKTRRLAYPIGRYQDAYYAVVRITADASIVDELERVLNISDDVLRHLVTRHDGEFEAVVEEPPPSRPAPTRSTPSEGEAAPVADASETPVDTDDDDANDDQAGEPEPEASAGSADGADESAPSEAADGNGVSDDESASDGDEEADNDNADDENGNAEDDETT